MKMVSAAKLKKAQDAIVMLRPYSEKLQEIIENLNVNPDQEIASPYSVQRDTKKILFITITSNRGLAGAFNSSVIKELNQKIAENPNAEIILEDKLKNI